MERPYNATGDAGDDTSGEEAGQLRGVCGGPAIEKIGRPCR